MGEEDEEEEGKFCRDKAGIFFTTLQRISLIFFLVYISGNRTLGTEHSKKAKENWEFLPSLFFSLPFCGSMV